LIFLSSVSWSFLPNGGRAEVSVDVGLSLFTGGEATRDDAGSGDEFPQRFFIGIGNDKALRRTFCPTGVITENLVRIRSPSARIADRGNFEAASKVF